MLEVDKICKCLQDNCFDFYAGVPDSLLKNFCAYLTDTLPANKHIITANEGCAVGLAAGHYMATGKYPVVYMQNSGQGNTVNPLLSLADEKVYSIPMLLIIGWRGEPGVKDEPQHRKQGEVTIDLLNAMQIPYRILSDNITDAQEQINDIASLMKTESKPVAIVIRKDIFAKYKLQNVSKNDYQMSREEAMKCVVDSLEDKDVIVSTTGKLSRELFEYREEKMQGHGKDFLTVGSMGHSSSIALGIALEKQDRNVYCFDGDGSFIMHTGAITNIGKLAPKNYRHIIFNNGAHESVGGQPTLAFSIDIPAIAKAVGYKDAFTAETQSQLQEVLVRLKNIEGPVLLEIKVKVSSRDNLGRPTTTPIENKNAFMKFLR